MSRTNAIAIRLTLLVGLLAAGATSAPWWSVEDTFEVEPMNLAADGTPVEFDVTVTRTNLDSYTLELRVLGDISHNADSPGDRWPVVVIEVLDSANEPVLESIQVIEPNGVETFADSAYLDLPCNAATCSDTFTIRLQRVDDAGGLISIDHAVQAEVEGSSNAPPKGAEIVIDG